MGAGRVLAELKAEAAAKGRDPEAAAAEEEREPTAFLARRRVARSASAEQATRQVERMRQPVGEHGRETAEAKEDEHDREAAAEAEDQRKRRMKVAVTDLRRSRSTSSAAAETEKAEAPGGG